ncbi:MAG: tyrosine-type recombinase/integrase [Candidatus Aenigmarchaeota archaeon]|nr:tyrosine-type recombinase/integrase [Candidatus Aenigmarchaeota archaeon]
MDMNSNKETIGKFINFCNSEGLSEGRLNKLETVLNRLSDWLGVGFKEAERTDIEALVVKINKSGFKDWTKSDYKKILKKFYKWYEGDGEECPKKVRWIKVGKVQSRRMAEELLTQEEVKTMIEHASNVRDKAIISVLYESGCRAGELLGLKIKSVQNKGSLVHIHVSGKTGDRPIPLVFSIPYLSSWINNHPEKNNPEASLFVSVGTRNNSNPIIYDTLGKMLRDVALKSGVNKKVNPHNFRHSRASYLANKLKEPQMRMFFGWGNDSEMPGTYVHLSGRDIDDAILEASGIKKPETDQSDKTLHSKTCPRCNTINEATGALCSKCMLSLNEQSMVEYEEKINGLLGFLNNRKILEKMIDERFEHKLKLFKAHK